ncbi:MAG TPA: hypothetical protein VGE69_04115 [Pseudomonadales bacterium]
MKKPLLFAATACLAPALQAQDCDRACLRDVVTDYLEALVAHDANSLPLAADVRFTEDHDTLQLDAGQWQSVERLGEFRQDVLDPQSGNAGVHVLAYENGTPVLIATRLKVAGGRVTEIESSVVRSREEGMIFNPEAITVASEAMNAPIPPSQRNTRDDMIELALRYPEGLRVGSFVTSNAVFGDEAYRFENGQLMAGPGCTFLPGCDNIREQRLPTLAGIEAKVAAVDEENGIVWLRMNFGPGSLMRGEGELSVWEMFKIYDGKIQAVEAFMEEVPADTPFGWDY